MRYEPALTSLCLAAVLECVFDQHIAPSDPGSHYKQIPEKKQRPKFNLLPLQNVSTKTIQ